jgi:hypothetical protein
MRPTKSRGGQRGLDSHAPQGEEAQTLMEEILIPGFVDTRSLEFSESTMARKHPPYTPEFRRQMIELVRAGRRRNWLRSSSRRRRRSVTGSRRPTVMQAAVRMAFLQTFRDSATRSIIL